jgi:hypothetical protein
VDTVDSVIHEFKTAFYIDIEINNSIEEKISHAIHQAIDKMKYYKENNTSNNDIKSQIVAHNNTPPLSQNNDQQNLYVKNNNKSPSSRHNTPKPPNVQTSYINSNNKNHNINID